MKIETNDWLSVRQFADMLPTKVSAQLISHYIKTNRLKYIRLAQYFYIHKDELKNWPPESLPTGRPKQ